MPDKQCKCCDGLVHPYQNPSYRHQVFEIPKPQVDITEYQVFHGKCQKCHSVSKGCLPNDASDTQMGPNLLSYIGVLAGQYHLSVRKIQCLLKEQFNTTFSIGAISEAQGRVSSMLTPLHQAMHLSIKKARLVHVDETSHQRNAENRTRWFWIACANDVVFQKVLFSRAQSSAKYVLGDKFQGIAVTDQCPSYNWLDSSRHQFCLAHVKRNLQQMADYNSGNGHTAYIGKRLTLLIQLIFRVRHRYENNQLDEATYHRRMHRIRRSLIAWLTKGKSVTVKKYAGRCEFIHKHEQGLWVFLSDAAIPLTNNEAERSLRGAVIMRKISYGTSSDRGDKFRSRILSLVETCKKRDLSPLAVLAKIINAVITKGSYPDVFGLADPVN